jgi:hypothetical protein
MAAKINMIMTNHFMMDGFAGKIGHCRIQPWPPTGYSGSGLTLP